MAKNDKQIRDVMTSDPVCVSEGDTIREAARIMAREDTGVVPVVEGKKIVGMITDRDIVVRLVAEGRDPASAQVNEAMSKNIRTVKENDTVGDVLNVMSSSQVRRVPVVNESNEIVGIVSMKDLADTGNQEDKIGRAVENISSAPPNN
jgi:CBS domain-containing protein